MITCQGVRTKEGRYRADSREGILGRYGRDGGEPLGRAHYRQHSWLAPDGPEGRRGLIASLPEGFRYEGARVIADGDLVALHGTYYGFGPDPMVAFDLFRVADGKLAQRWDTLPRPSRTRPLAARRPTGP